ncbi:hypothetical protein B0H34DRAFT_803026 [Crassisporium funariophilum]|nr:hypothetical protein B0H34DRAFT_803026 [Crassisporium funariophilum]
MDENLADKEVVALFQGILCKKDIAPYNEKNIPSGKVKYLCQSATLTAFGNSVFDKSIEDMAAIYAIFTRAIGDNLVEGAVHSTYKDFSAIDVANRYFTPRGGAATKEIRPLTAEVDLKGYLAKAAGSTYVHTEENKVYYFKKAGNKQSETGFQATGPQIFQVGDIVEVQVSFIAIPMQDNKWKIIRSISLFDGRFTQEVIIKSLTQNTAPVEKAKPLLKRRVGYAEEELSITCAKLAEMEIGEKKDKSEEMDNF